MTTISVYATVAGIHCWPDAPDRRAYLRSAHRHVFHIETVADVAHDDRDVEFHDLAERTETEFRALGGSYHDESTLVDFGARSCEMLARELWDVLERAGVPIVRVSVGEDGDVWAHVG